MESPERGALMLVRFVALALIGWTVAELTLYWAICHHDNKPMEVLPCSIRFLPLLVGVVMLIKARSLAAWVADKLDL